LAADRHLGQDRTHTAANVQLGVFGVDGDHLSWGVDARHSWPLLTIYHSHLFMTSLYQAYISI
jgi:hypothetical protein